MGSAGVPAARRKYATRRGEMQRNFQMATVELKVADKLRLPVDVVTLATAAVGIRGSGKTNTAVVMVEDLLAGGYQVIVLDPLDVWWGLKSSADGQRDGYPITVLGGIHGEVPLTETDGRVIADFLVDNPAPAILSMRHLPKSAQRRLVTEFAERLFHRKGEAGRNTPVLIVVDEASQFVPQRVMGEDARMVGAIQNWVRLGRASGIGVVLIDQRPASVNKDVLSQIELLIAHRVTSPQDRKALREWVDGHATTEEAKDFWDTISTLNRGEAWFWSPEWLKLFTRVQVRARRTFDSSATPKLGQRKAEPKKLAAADIEALKGRLAATIEKAKADDPRELKRQIAELRKQLAAGSRQPAAKADDALVVAEVNRRLAKTVKLAISKRDEEWEATFHSRFETIKFNICSAVNTTAQPRIKPPPLDWLGAGLAELANGANQPLEGRKPGQTAGTPAARSGHTTKPIATAVAARNVGAVDRAGELSGPQRKILDALAWWAAIGVEEPTNEQVAAVAGYTPSGGSFGTYLSGLSTAGLIARASRRVTLTPEGQQHAEPPVQPPGLVDLHERIRGILDGPGRKIFDAVVTRVEGGQDAIAAGDIAADAGYEPTGGSFGTYLSRLSTLGLIRRQKGMIEPTEVMWPARWR